MAIPATGRPPPEVGHHPSIPAQPLDYSQLFKSSPTIPPLQIPETANGGNPRPCGDPSPMSIPIPIKPIVYLHGEPTIRFEKKEVEVMIHHQELTLAIVGKFSHGWPDIAFLRNAIPKQCGLKAEVRIGLLCDRHVLIRCTIGEDFDTLMSRQTFEIKEKTRPYLMRTFKWDASFNPAEESRFAYGWISFPGLSPHYYGETTLFSLAAAVGSPIAIDAATLNKTRPSCARVKVEFDLLKSHPQHIVIQVGEGDGITTEFQRIRYDFKPKYCTNCKLQGHDVNGCWNLKPELRPENFKAVDGGKEASAATIGKGKLPENPEKTRNKIKNLPQKPLERDSGPRNSGSRPRAIGNAAQVSEIEFPPKNDLPKISDAGNPTGILDGAGNPTGNLTGTLGGAGNIPETLPATTPDPGNQPPVSLPAATLIGPPLTLNPLPNPNPNTTSLETTTKTALLPENHPAATSQVSEIFSAIPPPQTTTPDTNSYPKPPQNPKPILPETINPKPPPPNPPENPIPETTPDPETLPDPQPTTGPYPINPNPSPTRAHLTTPHPSRPNLI
ncbi:hypothetical protein RND71_027253 [Anisodus tanguticus]|uniref:DUF4283 domain-containing protein n=1 Tax=Anisodus tanguticus TaxID=243964 RepID=A0AAE1RHK6_9SOLA|nr:hypothetical protein RND71_027253 [Anisodus tanguticus]